MRALAAVAWRELQERRMVLGVAAAASLLPFAASLFPALPGAAGMTPRWLLAVIVASSFGVTAALLLGAGLLSRDGADRRLGFFFARPLPSYAIWGGKLAAGFLLVVAAEVLALFPTAAGAWLGAGGAGWSPTAVELAGFFLGPLLLLLVTNGVSVALRSRSPWIAIDAAAIVLLAFLLASTVRRAVLLGLFEEPVPLVAAGGAVLAGTLLLASYAQLATGRTDPRRAHGAHSLVVWATLVPAALGAELFTRWAADPGVRRLHVVEAAPAGSNGSWAVVQGTSTRRPRVQGAYLLDLATGRSVLLPPWAADVQVSANGRRALLSGFAGAPFRSARELVALDLGQDDPASSRETLRLRDPWTPHALSPEGDRAALVGDGLVQVLELPGFRLLASARLPEAAGWAHRPVFAGRDVLRLYPWRGVKASHVEPTAEVPPILELDVPGKRLAETGRYAVAPPRDGLIVCAGPGLARLLVREIPAVDSVSLVDARTGTLVATARDPGVTKIGSANFLADGRVLLLERRGAERTLGVLSPDGVRLLTIPLGTDESERFSIGFEVASGIVPVARWRGGGWMDGAELHLVDTADGSLRRAGKPIGPASLAYVWWVESERMPPPGSPVARLFLDADGRLVTLDPATLETRDPLAPGRPGE